MQSPTLRDLPPPPAGKTGWPWTEETPAARVLSGKQLWPKISVVTPSYNQVDYIEETLRSVLLQGYPDLEYIVMDGGSNDGSVDIIERYRPWLSQVSIGPDGGQSAAIAAGFARSTGMILAWLNSDDRYHRGALQRVGRYFVRHPRVGFVNSDVNHVHSDGRFSHRHFVAPPWELLTANWGLHSLVQPGCFWQRDVYERSGGVDASLRFCMDRDLFIRLMRNGVSRRLPGPPTADFRHHENAKSSTILDVASREGQMLLDRYAHPVLRRQTWLRSRIWRIWRLPTRTREWLHLRFGLDLA